MNYTIKQLVEMDTKFILLSDRGRYSDYIGKVCTVSLNPKNGMYEIESDGEVSNRCYSTEITASVLAYTEVMNPEYFL